MDHFETIRAARTARWLHVSLTISPVRDAAGRIVGASKVARDITERNAGGGGVACARTWSWPTSSTMQRWRLHWVGPDGIILRVNQAELTLLGHTRVEHVETSHRRVPCAPARDRGAVRDGGCTLSRRAGMTTEARLVCKDGTITHALIDANVLWEQVQFIHTRCFTRQAITAESAGRSAARQAHRHPRTARGGAHGPPGADPGRHPGCERGLQ